MIWATGMIGPIIQNHSRLGQKSATGNAEHSNSKPGTTRSGTAIITEAVRDREEQKASLQSLMFKRECATLGIGANGEFMIKFMNFMIWCGKWVAVLENEPERTGRFAKVVTSSAFEKVSMGIILANTCFIAYSSDYMIKHYQSGYPDKFVVIGDVFTCIFFVELICRLCTHRLYFFCNKDRRWNLFDLVVVGVSALDLALAKSASGTDGSDVGFMRLVRLLRISKMLRVVRAIKFFKELAVLVQCVQTSMTTLFWFLVLDCMVLFLFALILLHGMTEYMATSHQSLDRESLDTIIYWFGSLRDAMLSLVWAVTQGIEWNVLYSIIEPAGAMYQVAYLLFMMFDINSPYRSLIKNLQNCN